LPFWLHWASVFSPNWNKPQLLLSPFWWMVPVWPSPS
jgi:hypothetical protein